MLLRVTVSLLLVSTLMSVGQGQNVTGDVLGDDETLATATTLGEVFQRLEGSVPSDLMNIMKGESLEKEAKKAMSEVVETRTLSASDSESLRRYRIRTFLNLVRTFRFVRGALVVVLRTRGDYYLARRIFWLFRPTKVTCYEGDCNGRIGPFRIILRSGNNKYKRGSSNPRLTFVIFRFFVIRFRFVAGIRRR